MLKILVINQHTANFGDDAAGVAMAIQLHQQFPDAELHFVYNWPWGKDQFLPIPYKQDKTFHHNEIIIQKTDLLDAIRYVSTKFLPILIKNRPQTTISAYVNLVKESDFVIVSTGGSNIGIYQDWICLFRVLVAVLEKKRPVFHLNSLGKSGNLVFDIITKFVLNRSQVFVREKKSHEMLNKWGIYNVRGVDTALSLSATVKDLSKDEQKAINLDIDEESIVFIPTRIGSWHPLYNKMNLEQTINQEIIPSLITFSQKHNLKIYILPHLYSVLSENKLLQNIQDTFLKLGLKEDQVKIIENISNFRDYEKCISHGRLVISMRYHGVILSIKQGIPFISLAYENKMKEACNYSEMLDFNFDLTDDNLNKKQMLKSYELAYQNREAISKHLKNKLPILSDLSRLPLTYLYLKSLEVNKK